VFTGVPFGACVRVLVIVGLLRGELALDALSAKFLDQVGASE
jgi:hypothetical protein